LTLRDTRTPPVLNAVYEQIVNRPVTYNKLNWRSSPPAGPKQEQTRTTTGVVTSSHLDIQLQYREQELRASLAQHKLELEEEKHHRLRTQRIYSEFADSQNSLRRQLEVSRTREGKLQADLLAAEAKRRKLKDLIATLEASDVTLRADLTAADNGARDTAIMIDCQSKRAAEKDHVIRSTTNDLLAVRARLRDAEDKIVQVEAEIQSERNLRIQREKELFDNQAGLRDAKDKIARLYANLRSECNKTKELLDEGAKIRSLHEAEMRRIAKKAEDVQEQLNLLDDVLSQSRARTQSLLDDAHTPRLRNHAIAIEPDDTGQPPPPPLEPIPDVHTPSLDPVVEPRSPFSPKSLRQTPEHDPPTRHSPDHPRQISAFFDRVSDTANSWRARLESLLGTIYRLEAERALEAESRELSELCLQEELAATKEQLCATQEELAETKEQLRTAQEDAFNARRELDLGWETLRETKAHVEDFKRELEVGRAKLKDVQDARRAGIVKFSDAVELLRLRGADLEALRAEAEASQSKHSRAVSLSAVLRKRVTILEAEVKSLNRNQKCAEMHPAYANSQSFCIADTGLCAPRNFCGVVC
jgi:chromosome segregation ATPase